MNEKNKNLLVRAVAALVLLPGVLYLLYRGGYFSAALISVAAAICAGEYYLITHKRWSFMAGVGVLLALAMPLFPVWRPTATADFAFWSVAVFFFFAWGYYLIKGPLQEAPVLSAHLVTGLVYAGASLTALSALRARPDGYAWVICTAAVTWLNDTCAYFAGRFLGRHKLYPEVSPNKTWEGFAGGMVGSVAGMFAARAFFPFLTAADCLIVGLAGGVFGPMGDLCESMLKRAYQVKDSGKLIPGHGGLLDRIDALMFNGPVVFIYVTFLRP